MAQTPKLQREKQRGGYPSLGRCRVSAFPACISFQPIDSIFQDIFHWQGTDCEGRVELFAQPALVLTVPLHVAIAHALKTKIYCDARKAAILRCQEDPELNALLTSKPTDTIVHLVPLGMITSDGLKTYLDRFKGSYTKIIGFRPTGWTSVASSLNLT